MRYVVRETRSLHLSMAEQALPRHTQENLHVPPCHPHALPDLVRVNPIHRLFDVDVNINIQTTICMCIRDFKGAARLLLMKQKTRRPPVNPTQLMSFCNPRTPMAANRIFWEDIRSSEYLKNE